MQETLKRREAERRYGDRRAREQRDTATELDELLFLAQKMGGRLANEVHGDAYDDVRELNLLLHESRKQLAVVKGNLARPA